MKTKHPARLLFWIATASLLAGCSTPGDIVEAPVLRERSELVVMTGHTSSDVAIIEPSQGTYVWRGDPAVLDRVHLRLLRSAGNERPHPMIERIQESRARGAGLVPTGTQSDILATVQFEPGKTALNASARQRLDALAEQLRVVRGAQLVVQGFADPRNEGEGARSLSAARAASVAAYLQQKSLIVNPAPMSRSDAQAPGRHAEIRSTQ